MPALVDANKMARDQRERFVKMLSNQRGVPVPADWIGVG
jgi:hypothetical protein